MALFPASSEAMRGALAAVRRHFAWAAGFSALVNLLYLAPTIYMLQVYDRVVPTRGGLTLLFLTFALVLALGTLALLDQVRSRLLIRASARLDRMLAGTILDTILGARGGTRDMLDKQAIREFDTLRQSLTGPAIVALFDAPWTPIYILVCTLIHPWLGVTALLGTGAVLLIAWRNDVGSREMLKQASDAANRSYVSQEQSTAGAEVIRALGMRRAMVARNLGERAAMMQLQGEASFTVSRYIGASKFLRLTLQSLALGLGALLAIDDKISPGAIFAASFLLSRALSPVDQIVAASRQLVQARSAFATVNALLGAREAEVGLTQLPDPAGRLAVEHLTIFNPARDAPVVADVSFQLEPGEVIAVIGPSGAGKSTMARAVAGAIRGDRGAIRIDGADRGEWDQERLARFIGYLPQEPSLFDGSVRDNIARFERERPSGEIDADVVAAAQACGAHDMILRLPQGYDSRLGWGGRGLSAGQAQRVALARALYRAPPLVILDEPNAHFDAEGEASLVQALHQLKRRKTAVLIIAHRLGVMPAVDKILVLVNGRIEAFGARDEMLQRLNQGAKVVRAPVKAS